MVCWGVVRGVAVLRLWAVAVALVLRVSVWLMAGVSSPIRRAIAVAVSWCVWVVPVVVPCSGRLRGAVSVLAGVAGEVVGLLGSVWGASAAGAAGGLVCAVLLWGFAGRRAVPHIVQKM